MATIKAIIWKYRPKADGTFPIRIRTTKGNNKFYTNTGVYVKAEHWDESKEQVTSKYPNSARANNLIQSTKIEITNECMRMEEKNRGVSVRHIKKEIKFKNANFFEFAEDFYKKYNNANQEYTYNKYLVATRKFQDYLHGTNLLLKDLDYETITGFQEYLKGLGNYHTTIGTDMAKIQAIYNRAIKIGAVDRNHSPFYELELEKGPPKSRKEKLSPAEIDAIRSLEILTGTNTYHARNAFLFAYNNMGMRAGDVTLFKVGYVKDGKVSYRSKKSKDDFSDYELTKEASRIYSLYAEGKAEDDYLFPFFNSTNKKSSLRKRLDTCTSLMNKGLKDIAKRTGINKKISTHVARHSYAMRHIEAKTPIGVLQNLFGHESERTTKIYTQRLDSSVLSEYNRSVLE